MSVTIIRDTMIRFMEVEHKCEPGTGGGSTYRAQYVQVPWGTPYLKWSDISMQRNCPWCGEKLPTYPREIQP